jgi:hypothetical protein
MYLVPLQEGLSLVSGCPNCETLAAELEARVGRVYRLADENWQLAMSLTEQLREARAKLREPGGGVE